MQRGQLHLYCQNYSSLPAHRSGSHFYSLHLSKNRYSFQNAELQFTKRRCSFQNIPVSPPSHDRLNSATFPRAGIVFVALSSRRLYSIPRPYIRSSFTGCFNTCVFHTKSCPCLCSFLAYFVVCTGFKTQMRVSKHKCKTYLYRFQNTNTRCKTHMRVSKHKCKT